MEHAASAADPKLMAVGLGRRDQIQLDLSEAAGDAGEFHGPANTAGLGCPGLCPSGPSYARFDGFVTLNKANRLIFGGERGDNQLARSELCCASSVVTPA